MKNWREVPIPPRVATLPTHNGMPIPHTTLVEDGVPYFKVTDSDRSMACKMERRCGICGWPLDYWIAFIASPTEVEAGVVNDLPYHEDCARYAFAVCPWLIFKRLQYTDPDSMKVPEGITAIGSHPDREAQQTPDRMALLLTRQYDPNYIQPTKQMMDGKPVYMRGCKVQKPKSVEWFNKQ